MASTGTGLAKLVIDRSAELPTCTLADAVLLLVFGSEVTLEDTFAVSVMVEPMATPELTFNV